MSLNYAKIRGTIFIFTNFVQYRVCSFLCVQKRPRPIMTLTALDDPQKHFFQITRNSVRRLMQYSVCGCKSVYIHYYDM